jgi:ABC-type bacteriocin/lantibiotic exporter with double-glycine peptidase domain
MPKVNQEKIESTFDYLVRCFGYKKNTKLLDIDFTKPWWWVFKDQKMLVFIFILNTAFTSSYTALLPVFIGLSIQSQNLNYFLYCVAFAILGQIFSFFLYYLDAIFRLQTSQSINFSANKFFLTTDPIRHISRSSGQILSKINRASSDIDRLISLISSEFLSLFFIIISTVITFWNFDYVYGLVTLISLSILVIFNIFGALFKKQFEKLLISLGDDAHRVNIETLQQVFYIRSSFASNEQITKMKQTNFKDLYSTATSWRISGFIITITQVLFYVSLGILGFMMLRNNQVGLILSAALLINYYSLGSKFFNVGHSVKQLIKSYTGVVDLFEFIRGFGKQTYPVLEGDEKNTDQLL